MLPKVANEVIDAAVNPIYVIDNQRRYIPWKAAQDIHLCFIKAMYEESATFALIKHLYPILGKTTLEELREIWYQKMSKRDEKLKFVVDMDERWGKRRVAIQEAHDEAIGAGSASKPASG